jgi:hypothetical protein
MTTKYWAGIPEGQEEACIIWTLRDTAPANTICIKKVTGQDIMGPIMWKSSLYTSLLCDDFHINRATLLNLKKEGKILNLPLYALSLLPDMVSLHTTNH